MADPPEGLCRCQHGCQLDTSLSFGALRSVVSPGESRITDTGGELVLPTGPQYVFEALYHTPGIICFHLAERSAQPARSPPPPAGETPSTKGSAIISNRCSTQQPDMTGDDIPKDIHRKPSELVIFRLYVTSAIRRQDRSGPPTVDKRPRVTHGEEIVGEICAESSACRLALPPIVHRRLLIITEDDEMITQS